MDKVALGQVFFNYFGFPCQFSFHRLLNIHYHHHHHHHLSSGAGTIGQKYLTSASWKVLERQLRV
jgi:hypothetical protein